MKLLNKYYTFDFVEYDDNYKFPIITKSYPNYESSDIYIIGDFENSPLKLKIYSTEIRNLIHSKYF